MKITFVGDVMCEEPLLRASRRGKTYDFTPVFKGTKAFFSESDLVVANLETVFAGEEAGYTRALYSFNTPDSFAEAMKASGVDLVTTATNHALDRGIPGLERTLDLLDRLGVGHVGTARTAEEAEKICQVETAGKKIGFLNYTYGTNVNESPCFLAEDEKYRLNLLMPQKKLQATYENGFHRVVGKTVRRLLSPKSVLKIKKLLGKNVANKYSDTLSREDLSDWYTEKLHSDLEKAKRENDLVIVCLHLGGQFNEEPGEAARYFTRLFAENGADFVINTHPHVVQRAEFEGNAFTAYSLGNFSISPSSIYVPNELKPEYSVALHLELGEGKTALSFSILKILEGRDHAIRVLPADEAYALCPEEEKKAFREDVAFILRRFTGKEIREDVPVQREYPWEE